MGDISHRQDLSALVLFKYYYILLCVLPVNLIIMETRRITLVQKTSLSNRRSTAESVNVQYEQEQVFSLLPQ